MCVIIYQPEGAEFTEAYLRNFHDRNQDGVGLFYATGSRVKVIRNHNPTEDDIVNLWKAHKNKPLALHMRLRTHGDIDHTNTHPYRVLNRRTHGMDLFLAHNGILHDVIERHDHLSDTWHFVHDFLKPILIANPRLIYNEIWRENLGGFIGDNNKLLLMTGTGDTFIINEHKGQWHKDTGCWTSNTHGMDGNWFAQQRAKTPAMYGTMGYPTYNYGGGSTANNTIGWTSQKTLIAEDRTEGLELWRIERKKEGAINDVSYMSKNQAIITYYNTWAHVPVKYRDLLTSQGKPAAETVTKRYVMKFNREFSLYYEVGAKTGMPKRVWVYQTFPDYSYKWHEDDDFARTHTTIWAQMFQTIVSTINPLSERFEDLQKGPMSAIEDLSEELWEMIAWEWHGYASSSSDEAEPEHKPCICDSPHIACVEGCTYFNRQ
jgi:hypothetical protein